MAKPSEFEYPYAVPTTQPKLTDLTPDQICPAIDSVARILVQLDWKHSAELMRACSTAVAGIIAERDALKRAMAELEDEWDKVYRAKDDFEPAVRMDRLERILAINQIRKRAAAHTDTEDQA